MRNGRQLGVAFRDIRVKMQGMAYFPAFSMSQGERSMVNLGDRPFQYPPADPTYLPIVQTRPPVGELEYLLGCIERLLPALQAPPDAAAPLTDPALGAVRHGDAAFLCLATVVRQLGRLFADSLTSHPMLLFGAILTALVRCVRMPRSEACCPVCSKTKNTGRVGVRRWHRARQLDWVLARVLGQLLEVGAWRWRRGAGKATRATGAGKAARATGRDSDVRGLC